MDIYDQLRRDEGTRKLPYSDTAGKVTIGVGRTLTDDGLSDAEIETLLHNDVSAITAELNSRLPWFEALDPVRQGALVNMGFNLGFAGLENFPRMLMAFAQGDWAMAAAEMMNSEWSRQVGERASRLALQVKAGQ